MNKDPIADVERQIDLEFESSPLNAVNYSQSHWTVLSFAEDWHFKIMQKNPRDTVYQHAEIDALMNALTHPIRCIYKNNAEAPKPLIHNVIDAHYELAHMWVKKAIDYNHFNVVFPMYWKNILTMKISGNELCVDGWRNQDLRYEAYNRLIGKDGDGDELILDSAIILNLLEGNYQVRGDRFRLNLNPKLVKALVEVFAGQLKSRYKIPEDWNCCYFGFGDFRKIFTTIQSILCARFVCRSWLAMNGLPGYGYCDSVWVLSQTDLINRLSRYTDVCKIKIQKIIEYLIFGGAGIRMPDIAMQPIVDLKNGYLALSPFVFLHSNPERNFCVLINQIQEEKLEYSRLTGEKEKILKEELSEEMSGLGYRLESGQLGDTDLDFAVIDDNKKICIAFELKWFIEPAEFREGFARSKELEKGVQQAEKIVHKFSNNDHQLMHKILKIDDTYRFVCVVGSRNWIGNFDVQSEYIPIIKIKHFVQKIKESKCLESTAFWLLNREYLPKESMHYNIVGIPLIFGKWRINWYGIKPIAV